MNFIRAKQTLKKIIPDDVVKIEEYQDKYYFAREVQTYFPGVNEDLIYKAIDFTNRSLKPPRKKEDFIKVLSFKIFMG